MAPLRGGYRGGSRGGFNTGGNDFIVEAPMMRGGGRGRGGAPMMDQEGLDNNLFGDAG